MSGKVRFPDLLQARCPEWLPPLIEEAAERQCMTPAEYIRRSVLEGLTADGLYPRTLTGTGEHTAGIPRFK